MMCKCQCKLCELVKIKTDNKGWIRITCKYAKDKEFLGNFCDEPLVDVCSHFKRVQKDFNYYMGIKK